MDIENLYTTIKALLPYADQFLPQGAMKQNVNEFKKIIEIIDSLGGITAISQILKTNNTSQPVNSLKNDAQTYKILDNYKKICDLE